MITNIVLYPLLGHFFDREIITKKLWLGLTAFTSLCIAVAFHSNIVCGYTAGNCTVVLAVWIFVTIKSVSEHIVWNKIIEKIIYVLGKATFGVYLIHILLMHKYWGLYDNIMLYCKEPMITSLVWIFVVCIIANIYVLLYEVIVFFVKKVLNHFGEVSC